MNLFKCLFLTLALSLCIGATAQDSPFRFGINAGINLSNVTIGTAKTNGTSFRVGYQVGLTVDYAISSNFYLLSGLSFTTKGSKIEDLDYEDYIGGMPDFTNKFEQQYIQLPLYGAYKMNLSNDLNLMFGIGPYFAYGVGGKSKQELNSGQWSGGITEREFNTFGKNEDPLFTNELKRFDCGLGALVNLEYKRINLNIGYEHGLTNISKIDSYKYRNYNFTFSVGYKY